MHLNRGIIDLLEIALAANHHAGSHRPQCIVLRSLWNFHWQIFDGQIRAAVMHEPTNEFI